MRWEPNAIPQTARLLLRVFGAAARASTAFEIPAVPMSVNNQLISGMNKKTGKSIKWLDPRITKWRDTVHDAMVEARVRWDPRSVVAGVVVFESAIWVTKKKTVRRADADNRVKATFDAISFATQDAILAGSQWPDETLWEGHFYKLFGHRERTHVWLFDLGDVVEGSAPA